jgi:hypothetical protein
MRSLSRLAAVCLLGTAAWAGRAVAVEPRNSSVTVSLVARGDETTQVPAQHTESWRVVCKDRVWWYWTRQNSWMVWNGINWVHSPAGARYSTGPGSRNRSFSYQSEPSDDGGAYPSAQRVNSANESGLGYEGLAIPAKDSGRAPLQMLTGQQSSSTYTLSPEEQVHSAGESGLGYEGLR